MKPHQWAPSTGSKPRDYAEGLDHIVDEFHQLLAEDWKDTLVMMVWSMKCHISSEFDVMGMADVDIILGTVKDQNCIHLRQALQEEGLQNFNPEEEILSGQEMIKKLPLNKRYSLAIKEHIITVFDHLSNALSEQSLAAANFSPLAKITDEETLDIVLRTACRLMVQLNIPEKYLGPASKVLHEKIAVNLLPNSKRVILKWGNWQQPQLGCWSQSCT